MLISLLINLNKCRDYLVNAYYEKKLNISTSEIVELESYKFWIPELENARKYQATHYRLLNYLFKYLQKNFDLQNYQFIDYGCGKGRVLYKALNYEFKSVCGIDISSELLDLAKKNCIKHSNFRNLSLLNTEASKFIPNQKSIHFFYNPFDEYILDKVIKNNTKISGQIFILVNTLRENILIENNLELTKVFNSIDHNKRIVVYRN